METGLNNGVTYLDDALKFVEMGQIKIIVPTPADRKMMELLPIRFGLGESEAVPLCQRNNLTFITHDKKVANHCDRENIACIRLKTLAKLLENAGLLTSSEVDSLLA